MVGKNVSGHLCGDCAACLWCSSSAHGSSSDADCCTGLGAADAKRDAFRATTSFSELTIASGTTVAFRISHAGSTAASIVCRRQYAASMR